MKWRYIGISVIALIIIYFSMSARPLSYTQVFAPLTASVETTDLYKQIEAKKGDYDLPAQDAYIDKVWKKTPGLEGRKVNVKKSYEKMKKMNTFDEDKLVYDAVPTKVSLEDLPASPIYRGHPEKEMVTFLINVSWGEEHIPNMLKTLKEKKVKANFFIDGQFAEKNPDLVKMIKEEGHIIGNHAYNHPDMSRMDSGQIQEQIERTNQVITSLTDETPKWFAPPSGSYNKAVVDTAAALDMETILWSVDTVDWKKPTQQVMVQRVVSKIHPGAMVLMHPTHVTAQSLDEMIDQIRENGLKVSDIESLLSESR
ncbi:polysaccharide deacetylase family protein [Thalassobacillus sp. B23F22_16]|uniref:polysaccharide deacetylase family protein n=1 Tax=Thalassobacillus sp. B23F22_16 TaxID=3459513 RepID=UPI00373EFC38